MESLPKEIFDLIIKNLNSGYLFLLSLTSNKFRKLSHHVLTVKDVEVFCENGDAKLLSLVKDTFGWKFVSRSYTGSAARGGHLKIIKWLFGNGCKLSIDTGYYAIKGGHLSIVKWLFNNECKFTWDEKYGYPWNICTCAFAAKAGHLSILKWLREHGCPWDEVTCAWAAEDGHLHILKWARENGCPWDARTCFRAAMNNHFKILKWARENGCPWDRETARGGHLEVLQ